MVNDGCGCRWWVLLKICTVFSKHPTVLITIAIASFESHWIHHRILTTGNSNDTPYMCDGWEGGNRPVWLKVHHNCRWIHLSLSVHHVLQLFVPYWQEFSYVLIIHDMFWSRKKKCGTPVLENHVSTSTGGFKLSLTNTGGSFREPMKWRLLVPVASSAATIGNRIAACFSLKSLGLGMLGVFMSFHHVSQSCFGIRYSTVVPLVPGPSHISNAMLNLGDDPPH